MVFVALWTSVNSLVVPVEYTLPDMDLTYVVASTLV